jgi:hypothetical protein
VKEHGDTEWAIIANALAQVSPRQCKERWTQYLAPNVTRGQWTRDEDLLLMEKVKQCGQQWKQLETFFPGRKDNHLKNRHRLLLRHGGKTPIIASDCHATIEDEECGLIYDDEWMDLHNW